MSSAVLGWTRSLPKERLTGLTPPLWLCVGAGFAREEIKALLLEDGVAFSAQAVTHLPELCLRILGKKPGQLLSATARQEALRLFFAMNRINRQIPGLHSLKRQRVSVRHLDEALQRGRMSFAHGIEHAAYEERLAQAGMLPSSLRAEWAALSVGLEAWCRKRDLYDEPLLLQEAIATLNDPERGWPIHLHRPDEIWVLSVREPESLEQQFWDALRQWVQLTPIGIPSISSPKRGPPRQQALHDGTAVESSPPRTPLQWELWHTLDDAALSCAERIGPLDAIVIPDLVDVRWSLVRALEAEGHQIGEGRDPTWLKLDELMKTSLLGLEVVTRHYARLPVSAYLNRLLERMPDAALAESMLEINARGIIQGLGSYRGLGPVYQQLKSLQERWGGKRNWSQISQAHLAALEELSSASLPHGLYAGQFWEAFGEDLDGLGLRERKQSAAYWLRQIRARLALAPPPIERLKPREGVRIYRLQQAPVRSLKTVFLFGVPSSWLEGSEVGDGWWSERERDLLASEFAIRGTRAERDEKRWSFQAWIQAAHKVVILDTQFDPEGREQPSLSPLLSQLCGERDIPREPQMHGAHPRWLASYHPHLRSPALEVSMPPALTAEPLQISASLLDRTSRCPFQALAFHRWKARDLREPGDDLWPEARGTILHEAVRALLASQTPAGLFALTPEAALERSWNALRAKGLLQHPRIVNYVKSRLVEIIRTFLAQEATFKMRAGTQAWVLENLELRLETPYGVVVGKPDRIDRYRDGLFIIDYKSSANVPSGRQMIDQGYRLQLPFYAISVSETFQQPVYGAQFVQLDSSGARRQGIFFTHWNGPEEGQLTHLRSNSLSLIDAEPAATWAHLRAEIDKTVSQIATGDYSARPRLAAAPNRVSAECPNCRASDLCGLRRRATQNTGMEA